MFPLVGAAVVTLTVVVGAVPDETVVQTGLIAVVDFSNTYAPV